MMAVEWLSSDRRLRVFTTYIGSFKRCKASKLARAELSFLDMGSGYKENQMAVWHGARKEF